MNVPEAPEDKYKDGYNNLQVTGNELALIVKALEDYSCYLANIPEHNEYKLDVIAEILDKLSEY
jgi:mRNA-degrading endonuclease HigB of HigAB toxin-antitoxin module